MSEFDKIIQEQFADLPETIQVYITKSGWSEKLEDIAKANALNKEEESSLFNSTMIIVMAFRKFDEFRAEVRERVGLIGINLANAIKDVGDKILMPIKPELDKLWAESDSPVQDGSAKGGKFAESENTVGGVETIPTNSYANEEATISSDAESNSQDKEVLNARNDIMLGIEDPTQAGKDEKVGSIDLMNEKLFGNRSAKKSVTNFSYIGPGSKDNVDKQVDPKVVLEEKRKEFYNSGDPYREPAE